MRPHQPTSPTPGYPTPPLGPRPAHGNHGNVVGGSHTQLSRPAAPVPPSMPGLNRPKMEQNKVPQEAISASNLPFKREPAPPSQLAHAPNRYDRSHMYKQATKLPDINDALQKPKPPRRLISIDGSEPAEGKELKFPAIAGATEAPPVLQPIPRVRPMSPKGHTYQPHAPVYPSTSVHPSAHVPVLLPVNPTAHVPVPPVNPSAHMPAPPMHPSAYVPGVPPMHPSVHVPVPPPGGNPKKQIHRVRPLHSQLQKVSSLMDAGPRRAPTPIQSASYDPPLANIGSTNMSSAMNGVHLDLPSPVNTPSAHSLKNGFQTAAQERVLLSPSNLGFVSPTVSAAPSAHSLKNGFQTAAQERVLLSPSNLGIVSPTASASRSNKTLDENNGPKPFKPQPPKDKAGSQASGAGARRRHYRL